jgi:hypothetical protein
MAKGGFYADLYNSQLSRVNEGNLHGEVPTGPAIGREAW